MTNEISSTSVKLNRHTATGYVTDGTPVSTRVFWVNNAPGGGDDTNTGSAAAPFATIQKAILSP